MLCGHFCNNTETFFDETILDTLIRKIMYDNSSVFQYLKHPSRCIEAMLGEEDRHCFFVGTYSCNNDNELHLIEFIEETNEIITRNIFNHPNEIISIKSCPKNRSLLFICHRGGYMKKYYKPPIINKSLNNNDNNNDSNNDVELKDTNDNSNTGTNNDESKDDVKNEYFNDLCDDENVYHCTLWKLIDINTGDVIDDLSKNETTNIEMDDMDDDYENVPVKALPKNLGILPMFTLPYKSSVNSSVNDIISIDKVIWDPINTSNNIITLSKENNIIQLWKFKKNYSDIIEIECLKDDDNLKLLNDGIFDPHYPNRFITINDKSIKVWNIKNNKLKIISEIKNAHKNTILSIDHNPNKPYYIVTSSKDRTTKFWELRSNNNNNKNNIDNNVSKIELKILLNHSHWIYNCKFNRFHDQLLITSSSDKNICLWNIISISSATFGEIDNDIMLSGINSSNDTSSTSNKKENDKLITTYKEHEETVYSIAWSANNAWVFASLSYDGRIVINHVPAATKYKILL